MKISKNFSMREFTKSQTATRLGIDNNPTEEHTQNIVALVENTLQPIRDVFGPVNLSSGYRSDALNEAIGGSKRSQHSKGQAADFEVSGMANIELAEGIVGSGIEFDQLILEFPDVNDPEAGWIHISYNTEGNRKQVLTAVREGGKVVYKTGLVV